MRNKNKNVFFFVAFGTKNIPYSFSSNETPE